MVDFERYILAIFIGVTSCSYVKIWKKTEISGKFLYGYFNSFIANSVDKCAEECSCGTGCKSFGFNTDTFNCSLYEYFAYSGSEFAPAVNQFYYWEVQDNCSVTNGYQWDITETVCYKAYNIYLNWTEAMLRCGQDGAHLYISDTTDRFVIVKTILPGKRVHIGSTDRVQEGVWNWLNGIPLPSNSSMWTINEPNNWNETQHCLVRDINFSDIFCQSKCYFICEIPIHKNKIM